MDMSSFKLPLFVLGRLYRLYTIIYLYFLLPSMIAFHRVESVYYIYIYNYIIILYILCHGHICIVYVLMNFHHSGGLGQLMGVVCNRTHT